MNWTERLRRKLIHKLGGVLMDEVQPRPVAAAEKAGLVEWKEVPREEEPALYKMVDGIPGVEDAVLMRGTLRVLRKERG